jgi:DHA2 family multidrug resistance protein-like MFS transporter
VPGAVRDSIDEALIAAERLPTEVATAVISLAHGAFDHAFVTVVVVATAVLLGTAILAWPGANRSLSKAEIQHVP